MAWDEIVSGSPPQEALDWTKDVSDNFLIYGESKSGKTHLAVAKIKQLLNDDPKAKAYILNTDKGFADPAKKYNLHEEKFKSRIVYHPLTDLESAVGIIRKVSKQIKSNDILLFDLYNWAWEESQTEFLNEVSGGMPVGYIAKASDNPAKFGLFSGIQWTYVKKLEDLISTKITKNPICKIIAISTVKDVTASYAIAKKRPDLWYKIGIPGGKKNAVHEFSTTVKIEKIIDDENHMYRRFMVAATRKADVKPEWITYTTGEDFWQKIEKILI